jgi:hypothetical protein
VPIIKKGNLKQARFFFETVIAQTPEPSVKWPSVFSHVQSEYGRHIFLLPMIKIKKNKGSRQ